MYVNEKKRMLGRNKNELEELRAGVKGKIETIIC